VSSVDLFLLSLPKRLFERSLIVNPTFLQENVEKSTFTQEAQLTELEKIRYVVYDVSNLILDWDANGRVTGFDV